MYEIVTSPLYEHTVKRLGLTEDQEEEVYEGVCWALQKDPEKGTKHHTPSGITMLVLFMSFSVGDVAVEYHFEGNQIVLDKADWDTTEDFV